MVVAGDRFAGRRGGDAHGSGGGELEQEMAFGVVRQLFEVVLARRPPEVRAALLSAAAAPAARLFGTEPGDEAA